LYRPPVRPRPFRRHPQARAQRRDQAAGDRRAGHDAGDDVRAADLHRAARAAQAARRARPGRGVLAVSALRSGDFSSPGDDNSPEDAEGRRAGPRRAGDGLEDEVTWQDVECGSYAADLVLWSQLAREAAGPVLELGAGCGRVALRLAAEGGEVTALDHSAALVAELERRAGARGLELETVVAGAGDFRLDRKFAAIIAPMQLLHLLGGAPGRARMLVRARAHLAPGGALAAALLAERPGPPAPGAPPPLPDVAERDGWVYSSLPLEVRPLAGALEVRRLRQVVAPSGELSEEVDAVRLDPLDPDRFEAEAAAVGLRARERLAVAATDDHVGSVVCVLEVA
ncbi:MAG: methyltransferase domain-containing protein, partial [Solirubrobacterales bacterium]|nr:methyltransferase domain-containing protein [Solirubrobacterales bacterium]